MTLLRRAAGRRRSLAPAQVIATGFGAVIIAGTLLLMLPSSSSDGTWTPQIDALFTATSASA